MPTCPICSRPLETVRQREGVFYPCGSCEGRAMTISQIRRVHGDSVAMKLLRLMKLTRRKSDRACPFCQKSMLVLTSQEPLVELEACKSCNAIWFDGPTYESLPQLTTENMNSIPALANEIIAVDRLNELKKRLAEERNNARKKRPLHRILRKRQEDDQGPLRDDS